MKKSWYFFVFLFLPVFLFSPLMVDAAPLTEDLARTLDAMAAKYWDSRIQAAFGTFTYEYSGLATPFSRWLEDQLIKAASRTERLTLFNRSAAAAMDPAFRGMYGDFFATNQVDGLLTGKFFVEPPGVRLQLELTSLRNGDLIDARDVIVPSSAIPRSISLSPSSEIVDRAKTLATLSGSPSAPGGLTVSVSTDRGVGAAYYDGEKMTVFVSVNRDAYVKLYSIDAQGKTQLIWPNRFSGGRGFIAAGSPVRIPGAKDPFSFLLGAPYGTEFIKAVASTDPFAEKEEDFADLDGDAPSVIKRGLLVSRNTPQGDTPQGSSKTNSLGTAEALASYVIAKK